MVPAPGNKNTFMVASDSTSRPHFVQQKAGGKVICDDNCPMWRGRKVCSHTIAVAESLSGLKQFVQALQKSKLECNLTSLVTTPTDRRKAGTKSGAPRKRGRSKIPTTTTTYRNRLDDVCTTPDEVLAPEKRGPSSTPIAAYRSPGDDVPSRPVIYGDSSRILLGLGLEVGLGLRAPCLGVWKLCCHGTIPHLSVLRLLV